MGRELFAAVALLGACSPGPSAETGAGSSPIVVGTDDRRELFELDAALAAPLAGGSAALLLAHRLLFDAAGSATLRAESSGVALDLCPGERYADQPAAAYCSGVLIDDDLVATVGHCLGGDADTARGRCRQTRVVFGYALARPGADVELRGERIFSCRRLALYELGARDLAVIQLDRPVPAPLAPLVPAPARLEPGAAAIVASHGAGLPLKVELEATVLGESGDGDSFVVAMDTFDGSSGGGVFDQKLGLAGLIRDGAADWDYAADGCARAAATSESRERAQHADSLVNALCASAWPSPALCGIAHACGDGVCSSSESAARCSADCPAARCGDGLCELTERGTCRPDCSRYDAVPVSWDGEPELYLTLHPELQPSSGQSGGCRLARSGPAHELWTLAGALLALACRHRRASRSAASTRADAGRPR